MMFVGLKMVALALLLFVTLLSPSTADDFTIMSEFAASLTPPPRDWIGHPCNWSGIECRGNYIFSIVLPSKNLSGQLPPSLSSLSNLNLLVLMMNNLTGPIPAFSELLFLSLLLLQYNSFTSVSHNFLNELPILRHFQINNNPLRPWSFPPKLVASSGLQVLSVANSGLTGELPDIFNSFPLLFTLSLADNNLTGRIPLSLTTLTHLVSVDLSNNNFSGRVPPFPERVNVTFYPGNAFLGNGSKGQLKWLIVAIVITGVVVAIIILLLLLYKLYDIKNDKKVQESMLDHIELTSKNSVFEDKEVSIPIQVIRGWTNNFSEDKIIGRGGSATVFKGELNDGTTVAVKRMDRGNTSREGIKEFRTEIEILAQVRHINLVSFLGSCISGDENILIYEYMPRGTLYQHLFKFRENGAPSLTWNQRVTIGLDVARGLEYLHGLAKSTYIHRDLKPENILLIDKMRAKVGDFGLVKNAPDGKYTPQTQFDGTFGYFPPEYASTGNLTTKVDVYAYGVVLIQLITGKKAVDKEFHLATWFQGVFKNKDKLQNEIDQILSPDDDTYGSVYELAELAGHCTASDPSQRPDMDYIVGVLAPLVKKWTPPYHVDEEIQEDEDISLRDMFQRMVNEGDSRSYGMTNQDEAESSATS